MTERIKALREYILSKRHHALRRQPAIDPACYRKADQRDFERTALRLETFLENEQPVLLPDERIVFTRTLPALPMIYTDEEWERIKSTHYIHELGNVCNLSPDYGRLISEGLCAQLDRLDQVETDDNRAYLESMRRSILAVLALTARYAVYARTQGREDVA